MLRRPGEAGKHAASSDDARLLTRIVARDLRAFEALYKLYYPRLHRFIGRMLQRPASIEEVLNDTLMVVWQGSDRYNGTSKVSTWIFAIAYRKALKALRREDEPMEDKYPEHHVSDEPSPEYIVAQKETNALLVDALNDLSLVHKAVVDLAYFHDMDYGEIAEIMACPVDTVKTRMYHARRNLKAKLNGQLTDWL